MIQPQSNTIVTGVQVCVCVCINAVNGMNASEMLRLNFVSWENKQIYCGYITNSEREKLPVGLTAQWVEHCTGICRGHGLECRSSLNLFFRL